MFDYHVHTSYSPDSQMLMETACSRAVELGLKEIAITDHIDIDWPDSAFPRLMREPLINILKINYIAGEI